MFFENREATGLRQQVTPEGKVTPEGTSTEASSVGHVTVHFLFIQVLIKIKL